MWGQQNGDRELGTGNWGQGTGGSELGQGTGGQGTGGSKVGTGNLGQGTGSSKLGQGTGGRELGQGTWAGNWGQQTGDRELGTGTGDRELGAGNWGRELGGRELGAAYIRIIFLKGLTVNLSELSRFSTAASLAIGTTKSRERTHSSAGHQLICLQGLICATRSTSSRYRRCLSQFLIEGISTTSSGSLAKGPSATRSDQDCVTTSGVAHRYQSFLSVHLGGRKEEVRPEKVMVIYSAASLGFEKGLHLSSPLRFFQEYPSSYQAAVEIASGCACLLSAESQLVAPRPWAACASDSLVIDDFFATSMLRLRRPTMTEAAEISRPSQTVGGYRNIVADVTSDIGIQGVTKSNAEAVWGLCCCFFVFLCSAFLLSASLLSVSVHLPSSCAILLFLLFCVSAVLPLCCCSFCRLVIHTWFFCFVLFVFLWVPCATCMRRCFLKFLVCSIVTGVLLLLFFVCVVFLCLPVFGFWVDGQNHSNIERVCGPPEGEI